ncbi:MFS transporter [Streptomyces sp. JUS-F4]|uniref:MFS transporter n=1 Tax=Streptomyces TaxID=1883 RepID=UPI0026668334|nr:MFS transporter [Streptomyces sp. JUS-F4]WKN18926.1 MFS transporter [Streptomyces sp. JUS-F4]
MTSSLTPAAAEAESPVRGSRFALVVLALLWPTQLLSLVGMLTGNAQAAVAIHFQTTQIAWFILSTALVGTLLTPFVVKAADLYGKRQVMIAITLLGLVGDVIAASAGSYWMMLIGRSIAGFYGPIGALTYATIREVLPPKQAGTASSIVGSGVAFVAIGGPFLTGWVLDGYGFRGVLWSIVAATAIGLLLILFVVPKTHYRDSSARMDWIGGLLLGGGLTALTYGIGQGADWGWTSAGTLGCIIGGLVTVALFVVSQKRIAQPLVQLTMLSRRKVWTVILASALTGGALFGTGIISSLLVLYPKIPTISDGLGMTATHAAVIGLPASFLILAVGFGMGMLLRKVDARLPMILGGLICTVGYLLQAAYHYTDAELIWWGALFAIGFGMVVSVIPVLIMRAVSPEEQAIASGIQWMSIGVVTALVTTLTYVILARDGKVFQGTLFYLDQGYKNGFYFAAGVVVLGTLAALLIPRLKPDTDVEAA